MGLMVRWYYKCDKCKTIYSVDDVPYEYESTPCGSSGDHGETEFYIAEGLKKKGWREGIGYRLYCPECAEAPTPPDQGEEG